MNHVFRSVFNRSLGVWQAVAETARGRGKGSRSALLLAPLLLTAPAFAASPAALPTAGEVKAGRGTLSQTASTLTVDQRSRNLAIDWRTFDIGRDATVTFRQPGANAIALNRVLGADGSQILGRLQANGQVWVLNPNGVLFGRGAQVDVGGLVASTLNLSDDDFLAGRRSFSGPGGAVVNQGSLRAGYVALLGGQVRNEGRIVANLGTAALAAGDRVTLDFAGDRLLNVQVDQGALRALVDNRGLVQADGGAVLMTASARDALLDTVVNSTGVVRARTLENRGGRIELLGDMDSGRTQVGGTLDASAPTGGDGGFIETSAAQVKIADGTRITTKAATGRNGLWLIDPTDFTVAASGGDMSGATLANALAGGDVTIESTRGATSGAGDVSIKDRVAWSANRLTLKAQNDIHIRAQMDGSGTAGLALEYGLANVAAGNTADYSINAPVNLASTASFSTRLGSDGNLVSYTILTSLGAPGSTTGTDLQGIAGNPDNNYVLGADIDASETAQWNGGAGFLPIAGAGLYPQSPYVFTGRLDGLGHVVDGLTINRPGMGHIGLFGGLKDATISHLGVTHANIVGGRRLGILSGMAEFSTIRRSFTSGSITGGSEVGGVVGTDLVPRGSSVLDHVHSSADVTATDPGTGGTILSGLAGGLIGSGGLSVSNSYATGHVVGGNYVGGLGGRGFFAVSNSWFGGTLGSNGSSNFAAIANDPFSAYAWTNVRWNTDTVATAGGDAGSSTRTNVTGLTTAQMQDPANWTGFNFTNGASGKGWVKLGNALPMLASEWSPVVRTAHQLQLMQLDLASNYRVANDIDARATRGKDVWTGTDFRPIGWQAIPFTGTFDGGGHTIAGLQASHNEGGLFGHAQGAILSDVRLTDVKITGGFMHAGGLAASVGDTTIRKVAVDGGVTANGGTAHAGGLVGEALEGSRIEHARAAVTVRGGEMNGGLVGRLVDSTVTGSHAGGTTSSNYAGGLVGVVASAVIEQSYATGSAFGIIAGGGLIASTNGATTLRNVYATGAVDMRSPDGPAGGLVGELNDGSSVSYAYAAGAVRPGVLFRGGLYGLHQGSTSFALWDVEASGQTRAAGLTSSTLTDAQATGLATAQMKSLASLHAAGWAPSGTNGVTATGGDAQAWRVYDGQSYPLLRNFLTPLQVAVTPQTATYNGATQHATGTATITAPHDSARVLGSATASGRHAGNHAFSALYSTQDGYDLIVDGSFTITPANLTLGTDAVSKIYDGTLTAAGALKVTSGALLGGDSMSGGRLAFADRNAGTGKTVNVAGATIADGNGGNNYRVTYEANSGSEIRPAALAIAGTTAAGRGYDGTTDATITAGTLSGLVGGETLGVSATGTFDSRNAGARTATAQYRLADGTGRASNYTLADTTGHTATITPAAITVSTGAVTKAYDGTTSAAGSAILAAGTLYASDSLSGGSFAFVDKNAGSSKTVTVSGVSVADGNGGGNYSVTHADNTGSVISRATLTITGTSAAGRTYNGTSDATITAGTLSGLAGGETLGVSATGAFDSRNAGGRTATAHYTLADGTGRASNYELADTSGHAATISRAMLTVAGTSAAGRTYDGTTVAAITAGTLSGLVGGETLGVSATGSFDNRNAGNRTATAHYTLANGSGLASNYELADTSGHAATITRATLTIDGTTAAGRAYNGTTVAGITTGTLSGLVGGETLGVSATGAFDSRNAGGRTATAHYTLVDGSGRASNYELADTTGHAATISRATLTIAGTTAADRTYNGTTVADIATGTLSGLVGGETLGVSATGTFDSRNAGNRIATAHHTLSNGTGLASNYELADTTGHAATISRATLTIAGTTAADRAYNGTTDANITAGTLSGLIGGETLGVSATGAFDSRNAGKRSATAHYTLADGSGLASNYELADTTGHAGTINRATLTIAGSTAADRTYNGTTNATITAGALSGLVRGETLGVSATGAFDSRDAGNRNATAHYTLGDGTGQASNYVLADTTGHSATISRATLNIDGTTAAGRTYDGTTAATITAGTLSGLVGGETLGVRATGAFDSRNAGDRTATAHYTLSNGTGQASNYVLADTQGHAATITPAAITVSTSAVKKTYDGTTSAAGTAILAAGTLYGSDRLGGGSFAFADKNAGTGKTVNASQVSVADGNGGGNYTVGYAANTVSTILRAPLRVRANDARKTADGQPWRGGNGVRYTGFVHGEGAAVLEGALTYGGSAQGATDAGTYTITPGGLTASNYAIRWRSGTLAVAAAPADPGGGPVKPDDPGSGHGSPLLPAGAIPRYTSALAGNQASTGPRAGAPQAGANQRDANADAPDGGAGGPFAGVPFLSVQGCGLHLPAPLRQECR